MSGYLVAITRTYGESGNGGTRVVRVAAYTAAVAMANMLCFALDPANTETRGSHAFASIKRPEVDNIWHSDRTAGWHVGLCRDIPSNRSQFQGREIAP